MQHRRLNPVTPKKVHETLKKYILADGLPLVYDPAKSRGAYLHDSLSGEDYLDCFSFFATMPVGHNHPKIDDPEFKARLGELAAINPSNSDVYTLEYAEFVDRFGKQVCLPYFEHLFFVAGGSVAVENALKAAFDWKARKSGRVAAGETDVRDLKILHFKQAFHGRTGYTLSLTNTSDPRKYQHFTKFDWPRITNPKITFPLHEKNLERVQQLEEEALGQIQQAIQEEGEKIAAVVIEPIQAEGGDNYFRPEFLQTLREIADKHEMLYILDEVQTGMGLTGKMWAFEHYGFVPDIAVFGKKSQVCGFASTRRIDGVEGNVFQESSRINSTWGGNLIDMVRCTRYLEIIEEESLVENARKVGDYTLDLLRDIQKRHEDKISNSRGKGLMIAFDLPSSVERNRFLAELRKKRLLVLPCGDLSIRLRPHLDFPKESAAKCMEMIADVANNF